MVRMTSTKRKKQQQQQQSFNKHLSLLVEKNKFLNIPFFFLVITGCVIVAVTLFFYLASTIENDTNISADTPPISSTNYIKKSSSQSEQLVRQESIGVDTELQPTENEEKEEEEEEEEEKEEQRRQQQQQLRVPSDTKKMTVPISTTILSSASQIITAKYPFLVYGTAWKKDMTATYVQQAIHAGFRFIDTACQPKHYNESGVGIGWTTAATELQLQRHDIYLQTKFTSYNGQDPNTVPYNKLASLEEQVQQSLHVSLTNLQTSYLDSLVMHSPERHFDDTMRVYRTMESFVDTGTVLRLGISNCYDYDQFVKIYTAARIKPTVLQNRFYSDTNFDTELRQFCNENNIWYQSFWTLSANRHALGSSTVKEWATRKSLTPQTLMYAYLLQLGYVTPLSGTTSVQHMKDDVAIMQYIQKGNKVFENDDEIKQFEQILGM